MTVHSIAPAPPTWPHKVPPAAIAKQQPSTLPPLGNSTIPRSLPSSTAKQQSTTPFLTYNRSPAPYIATQRSSSAPHSTPGLYHTQPAAATPQPSTGKPRWFTNKLTLTAAVDERVDFTRYSGHTSLSDASNGRRWTRDDMLDEIYAQKRREIEKLRRERARLDQQLANRHIHKQYAASREELLEFLQSHDCGLFVGAKSVIAVKDRELDRLVEVGGEELVDWTGINGMDDDGSGAGRGKRFLVLVRRINAMGLRFDSFKALVVAMKMVRAEMENAAAQAVTAPAAVEEPEPAVDQPEEPTPQTAEADDKSAEEPTPEPAIDEPQPTPQVDEAEPAVIDPQPPISPLQPTQPETVETEVEEKKSVEEPFVLPEDSRNRNHSISQNNNLLSNAVNNTDDDTADDSKQQQQQQHARHNTLAEGQQPATDSEKLSVGSLMEKLAELEEEQEGEEEAEEGTGTKEEKAAPTKDNE